MAALLTIGSVSPAFAASGVTNGTMEIGGQTASISTINMTGNRTLEIMVANQTLDTHQSGKAMISAMNQTDGPVVAAVNGGFFSLSDWSVCNTMVQDGRLIAGGGWSNAVGITYDGQILIDAVKLLGTVSITKKDKAPYKVSSWIINRSDDSSAPWVALLNEYCRENVKVPAGGIAFFVENGVVSGTMRSGIVNPMPQQDVMLYNAAAVSQAEQNGTLPMVGDAVSFGVSAEPQKANTKELWENAKTVMGGAVMLVSNHQVVAYKNGYTAADQQPNSVRQRVFVAKSESGELVMGTVYSSYVKIAEALASAGFVDAMAMDGGSSSMLYSNGKYLRSAGRELTMGLAVVDSASVSRIPNTAGNTDAAQTAPGSTEQEPQDIPASSGESDLIETDAEDDNMDDMEAFFQMVDQAFKNGNTSDVNANYVSMNPEMRPNTSVSFAPGKSETSGSSGNTIVVTPPDSETENQTPVVSGGQDVPVQPEQSSQKSYLTQKEFMTLLTEVMEKKQAGSLISFAKKSGFSVSSNEEAVEKLGIFSIQDPNIPITRAHAASALMKAHRLLTNENSSAFYAFSDCSGMKDEDLFAINYVVGNGMLAASGSIFQPNTALNSSDADMIRNNF